MNFFNLFYVEPAIIICIAAAWLIDLVIGKPRFIPQPSRLIGLLLRYTGAQLCVVCAKLSAKKPQSKELYERRAAVVLAVYLVLFSFIASAVLLDCARSVHPALYYLLNTYLLYTVISVRKPADEAYKVLASLKKGEISKAYSQLSALEKYECSTPNDSVTPANAPESAIIRTAVSAIAERTIDSTVSPLFYIAAGSLLGVAAPLATAFSAVCILENFSSKPEESAAEVQDPQKEAPPTTGSSPGKSQSFGLFSFGSRLYIAANYIPARICGLLVPAASFFCTFGFQRSFHTVRRDSQNYMEPNSAQSAAAYAGALNIQLGGDCFYRSTPVCKPTVGDDGRIPEPDDIKAAVKIMATASTILMLLLGILLFQFHR